jgi:hypothetical protein
MSQNQNLDPTRLTPDDVRRLVIALALAGVAATDKNPPGWIVERAFHIGDRVKELLEAEERGEPLKQWSKVNRHYDGPPNS